MATKEADSRVVIALGSVPADSWVQYPYRADFPIVDLAGGNGYLTS